MADTNPQVFYRSLPQDNDEAFAYLAGLNTDPDSEENEWRDYKEVFWWDGTQVEDNKLKDLWSENLSAFANSGGGVLIFGWQTKGRRPHARTFALDAPRLRDRLLTLVNTMTDPFVGRVEVRAVTDPAKSPKGFVVALIPAGIMVPHRALYGERTCWMRNQDSNYPAPTAHLRMMFYPQVKARLRVQFGITISKHPEARSITAVIKLVNSGPATAENVVAVVHAPGLHHLGIEAGGQWARVGGHGYFFRYPYPIPPNLVLPEGFTVSGLQAGDVQLEVRLFCHNMPLQYIIFPITEALLAEAESSSNPIIRTEETQPWTPSVA